MGGFKNILVLSRLTNRCRKAVDQGMFLAERCGANLNILHVFHNPFGLEGWNLPTGSLEKDYRELRKQARHDIDNLVEANKPEGMKVNIILKEGNPDKELFKTIKEYDIDLLIFVSHSEWRMEHFIFGRSNEKIIRELPCSVMMLKDEPHAVGY